jgi:hypothetical protein
MDMMKSVDSRVSVIETAQSGTRVSENGLSPSGSSRPGTAIKGRSNLLLLTLEAQVAASADMAVKGQQRLEAQVAASADLAAKSQQRLEAQVATSADLAAKSQQRLEAQVCYSGLPNVCDTWSSSSA